MGDVHFQRESVERVRGAELMILLEAHYREIAHYRDIPLAIDWAAYERLERNKTLRVYTARADDARLIGYAAFIVHYHPHYMSSLHALQDVVFLVPECRKQLVGYRFMAWCDRQLAAEGVQVVMHHSKIAHPMDAVLQRLRYEPIDMLWGKRLDLWVPRRS